MENAWIRALAVALLSSSAGCYTLDSVDLDSLLADRPEFAVSADATPETAAPCGALSIQQDGFYLFGYVPIARVSLEECVDALVGQARELRADGISNLRFNVIPPSMWRFTVFPIPDWSATVTATATAYRREPGDGMRRAAPDVDTRFEPVGEVEPGDAGGAGAARDPRSAVPLAPSDGRR